jgi:hypothetical protein
LGEIGLSPIEAELACIKKNMEDLAEGVTLKKSVEEYLV